MTDFLIATANPGKLHEFAELLAGLPARLVSPADLGWTAMWPKPAKPMRRTRA
jgi:hypothetical protein